ncbi:hypothetical protein HT136_08210 [Novosphingobium profundi]|uniref:hypothetical protein n=1 Tax=Novosphingobium profundi TaxID=1774954 RepID=UPI001BDA0C84|nr:hypothetical protein [Novosphingobium profundi]MBT0668350.1 hypothetical protein [Novosphingobium profundi]
MLLLASLTVFVQLDRQTLIDPGLTRFVPEPFRYDALLMQVAHDEQGQDLQAQTRSLLSKRPVISEAVSAFAVARIQAGDLQAGVDALTVAASRGWRDPTVQVAMANFALEANEDGIAADRLSALWKTQTTGPQAYALTKVLLDRPDGRKLLTSRLTSGKYGMDDFALWGARILPPQAIVQTFRIARAKGYAFDCADLAETARNFALLGELARGEAVWSGACAQPGTPKKTSDAFVFDQGAGPLDWSYPGQGGLTREFQTDGSGPILHYRNQDAIKRLLAQRLVALAPGSHAVRLDMGDAQGLRPRKLLVRMICLVPGKGASSVQEIDPALGQDTFDIPAKGCPAQRIDVLVGSGEGDVRAIRFS